MNSNTNLNLSDLGRKLIFTLLALVFFRIGTYVPIPGISLDFVDALLTKNPYGDFFGMLNLFSGGALGRLTIFSLNVMPYIVSSIVVQLLFSCFKGMQELRQSGEEGRRKINATSRLLAVLVSTIQAIIVVVGIEHMTANGVEAVLNPNLSFRVTAVASLVGGTMFLIWLGDKITAFGIANGISLIIFTGIVSELPASLARFFSLVRLGSISILEALIIIVLALAALALIVKVERSSRKITVRYPKHQAQKLYGDNYSHIPVKINVAGVIPPIFANALLSFPIGISSFYKETQWSEWIVRFFSPGSAVHLLLYVSSIVFFCFFYAGFVFNVDETASMLRKNNILVPGRSPGPPTRDYLKGVLDRITLIGAAYLAIICVVPDLLKNYYSVSLGIGGTGLLILVGVIMEIFSNIQSYLFNRNYNSLVKKRGFYV